MKTPKERTQEMSQLLKSAAFVVSEALQRDDIGITGIDIGAGQISIFTTSAGARQHLANALGLPASVHESRFGLQFRSGMNDRVRIYGKDE